MINPVIIKILVFHCHMPSVQTTVNIVKQNHKTRGIFDLAFSCRLHLLLFINHTCSIICVTYQVNKINIRSKTSFDILFGQKTVNNNKITCINIQLHHQTNNSICRQALTLNVCVVITKRFSIAFIINHLHKEKFHTQN